jgi:hypothetical protein
MLELPNRTNDDDRCSAMKSLSIILAETIVGSCKKSDFGLTQFFEQEVGVRHPTERHRFPTHPSKRPRESPWNSCEFAGLTDSLSEGSP